MRRIVSALLLVLTASQSMAQTTLYLRNTLQGVTISGDGAQARALSTTRGSTMATALKSTVAGPIGSLGTSTQMTLSEGGARISWLSGPWQSKTITGTVSFQLSGFESSAAANGTMTMQLLRTDISGNILSTIASAVRDNTELGTTDGLIAWSTGCVPTTLNTNDRLLIRVYIDEPAGVTMASGQTVFLRYNGPSNGQAGDSKLTIPQNLVPAVATSTVTHTFTATPTISATPTVSATDSPTPTVSATLTVSATFTPTFTASASRTLTFTASASRTPTFTITPTPDFNCYSANRTRGMTLTDANVVITPTSGNALRPVSFQIGCRNYATAECEGAVYRVLSAGVTLVNGLSIEQPAIPPSAPLGSATAFLGCYPLPVNEPLTIVYDGQGSPSAIQGTFTWFELTGAGIYTWP